MAKRVIVTSADGFTPIRVGIREARIMAAIYMFGPQNNNELCAYTYHDVSVCANATFKLYKAGVLDRTERRPYRYFTDENKYRIFLCMLLLNNKGT